MDVYPDVAAKVMCEAYKKKMTMEQGYIWFLPDSYPWDWYNPDRKAENFISCTFDEMTEGMMDKICCLGWQGSSVVECLTKD